MAPSKRTAIVTGAAQGIGEAIALRLAQDGLNVLVSDLRAERAQLDALVERVGATGQSGIAVGCNVAEEKEVVAMIDKAVSTFGGLDVVCFPILRNHDSFHSLVPTIIDGRECRYRNVQDYV